MTASVQTLTITHEPHGIDDPYKRLPTERDPRDPQPGDTVRVAFQADAEQASVRVTDSVGEREVPAVALGGGQWAATLGEVASGTTTYRIHAARGEVQESSAPYTFTVGHWQHVTGVRRAWAGADRALLALDTESGVACVQLSIERSGVCALRFTTDPPEPGDLPEVPADLHLTALGTSVHVDPQALTVTCALSGGGAATASLALRWLADSDGLEVTEVQLPLDPHEALYGLGERFDGADRRGKVYDVRVYEEYKEQGPRTYLPVPFVVSDRAWGAWLAHEEPSTFDLRGDQLTITVQRLPHAPATLDLYLMAAERPYGVTATFTALTGGLALPPRWAFGPWMSSNDWNSQARTLREVRRTLSEDVPATVLVLEAWSDESTFYIFNDARYTPTGGDAPLTLRDFTFGGRWPDPKALVDECHAAGIHVLLWQIPVQKRLEEPHAQHDADERVMLDRGYAIRAQDGSAYRCRGWWFTDGLVMDFSHPGARDWWFAKRQYLLDELGIDGMKTDGGEHLWGRDLRAHDGRRGLALYNAYSNGYVGAYHDFILARTRGEGLTFSRAGYTGAGRTPGHWAGDENSTWDAYRHSIQAGLSAGVSGVSLWAWDIAGFSGDVPTAELYLRSTAFATFCPLMQYHSEFNPVTENRDRTPWNIAERTGDPRALDVYRRYAQLRMRLLDDLHEEARHATETGAPLMRYPALEYPEARAFLTQDPHAYLFGRDLLVCPVVEKGALAREVILPPGDWTDLWSGSDFSGNARWVVPAPLDRIPVFVRRDSPRRAALLTAAAAF